MIINIKDFKEKQEKLYREYLENEKCIIPSPEVTVINIKPLVEENKHKQKVIDRLSRQIQKQKKIISIMSNSNYILEQKYRFLMHRENKLQQIEQMFKSGTVDLKELTKLVNENL